MATSFHGRLFARFGSWPRSRSLTLDRLPVLLKPDGLTPA